MSERGHTRRRYLLGALPVVASAGCLRLSEDDGGATTAPGNGTGTGTTSGGGTTTGPETTSPPETTTDPPTDGRFDGWFADVDDYDGVGDLTGQSTVDVQVGAGADNLAFSPPAIRISQGATVVWEWTGEGGSHNVRVEDQPGDAAWNGYRPLQAEPGFTYEHAFETPGTYLYYCGPHLQMGMKGAVVVDDGDSVGGGGGDDEELAFELIEEDTRSDPEVAMETAQELVDQEVPFVCGPALSSSALRTYAEVFPSADVVGCSPSATIPELTGLDDDGFGFRTVPSDVWGGRAIARGLLENGVETAGVLYVDYAYGQTVSDSFTAWFEELGGSVTTSVAVPQGGDDYAEPLEEVISTEPGALVVVAFTPTGRPLLRQYYEAFPESVDLVALSDGLANADVAGALAEYNVEDRPHLGVTAGRGPGRDQFVELYQEAYGEQPRQFAAQAYDAAVVGLAANAAAGENDGAAIRDRIRTVANPDGEAFGPLDVAEVVPRLAAGDAGPLNYQGAGSVVDFDENGDVVVQFYQGWRFENGGVTETEVYEIPQEFRPEPGGPAAEVVGGGGRTLRIGGLFPLSGALEPFGVAMRQAARLPILQLQ